MRRYYPPVLGEFSRYHTPMEDGVVWQPVSGKYQALQRDLIPEQATQQFNDLWATAGNDLCGRIAEMRTIANIVFCRGALDWIAKECGIKPAVAFVGAIYAVCEHDKDLRGSFQDAARAAVKLLNTTPPEQGLTKWGAEMHQKLAQRGVSRELAAIALGTVNKGVF